jgi:hypothetical protein
MGRAAGLVVVWLLVALGLTILLGVLTGWIWK